ncbi:hypothetical protein [Paenibacillus lactis]|uniref:hypothetical protein n=1 Tax=Paenibacillus lactis TaxID=228574 RepID=UPI003D70AD3F
MTQEDKRFYHKEYCHPKFLKEKERKRIENEQWDTLYQYIIKLHDLVVLPTGNITRLQDLRAGFTMKEGKKVRQWKNGPDFALMLEAYKLAEDSIKWCIVNKLNGSKDAKAINYGISIMINKLNEANANRKKKARNKVETEIVKEGARETNRITNMINQVQNENVNNLSEEIDVTTLFD